MARRKLAPLPSDWIESHELTVNGRQLTPGTELSIRGERGRFRFVKHVTRSGGIEWVDVWGGPKRAESMRSFRPDRIRTVHRISTTDKALVAARKEARK